MEKNTVKFHIVAILAIVIFCAAIVPIALQNDTFYTIKIGEYITQNGIEVGTDPFTWHENLEYTYPHWAYDLFIYLVYDLGGNFGIYLSTMILSAILGLAIYLTHCKINKNKLISFFVTVLVMYLLKDFITARAQLVTFIIFMLEILFIEKFLETKKKIYGIGLIILPFVIANVHSAVWPFYFVLLLPYIVEYIFNRYMIRFDVYFYKSKIKSLNKKINKPIKSIDEAEKINCNLAKTYDKLKIALDSKGNKDYISDKIELKKEENGKWLILVAILAMFTGFLTPIGDSPFMYTINIMMGDTTSNISEHLPLTLANNLYFAIIFGITVAIAIFTKIKLRLKDWFMIVGLIILAFISRRQASMVYLIALIPIANMLIQILEKRDPEGTDDVIRLMVKPVGIIVIIVMFSLMSFATVKPKLDDVYISEKAYPIKAAEFINKTLDVDRIKLFNEYNYGSYLLLKNIPVFIDSRSDLYTTEFNDGVNIFNDYLKISGLSKPYEDGFKEYGVTHIILTVKHKMNLLLEKDDNYEEIYSDDNFKIYERLNSGYSSN